VATLLFIATESAVAASWRQTWISAGYDVVSQDSIDRAVVQLRDGGVDLIVLDTHDSLGSISNLVHNLDRLVDAPPLLLISDSPTAPEISARIGVAGFLAKPCEQSDLLAEIVRLVGPLRTTFTMDEEPTGLHRVQALSES
jgi:DNA-binding NtrC family response regulator